MTNMTTRYILNTSWLILLRWVAVIGQLVTIGVSALLIQVNLSWVPLLGVVCVTSVSNYLLQMWFRNQRRILQVAQPDRSLNPARWDLLLGSIMAMDMASLTILLYVSGGVNNPFFLFFFVNLSLSAAVLSRPWAWILNVFTIACFAVLLIHFVPVPHAGFGTAIQPWSVTGRINLQQLGLLIALATCSSIITYFMTRLTSSLRKQEKDLLAAESVRADAEKLEALGTLAAGAAHELASPLSTIAIVAKDMESMVQSDGSNTDDMVADVKLMRTQVDRCRKILDRMAGHAGQTVGETLQTVTVDAIINEIQEGFSEADVLRLELQIAPAASTRQLHVPLEALSQSLRGIVQNAIHVEPPDSRVRIDVTVEDAGDSDTPTGGVIRIQVRDHGPGMTPEVLKRVSEPFFTTKPAGQGMGLGVFLAKNVLERIGGTLNYQSTPGAGTHVSITLPTASQAFSN